MPARTLSSYNINTAAKVYVDGTYMMLFSTMRLTKEGVDAATKDAIDYLKQCSNSEASEWPGKSDDSIVTLAMSEYPAIEHRFHIAASARLPAGYVVSRLHYVAGRVCTLSIHVSKDAFETKREASQRVISRFLDSLVIDASVPAGEPFTFGATPRVAWRVPDPSITRRIRTANGMLTDQFAFCQTMPLDEFYWVAEELRSSGYRPIGFRPFSVKDAVNVAAIWERDGGGWVLVSGQTPDQLSRLATETARTSNPVDVAGWEHHGGLHFGVLWQLAIPPRGVNKVIVGQPEQAFDKLNKQIAAEGYSARGRHRIVGPDGVLRESKVAFKPRPNAGLWHIQGENAYYESELKKNLVPYDVHVSVGKQGKIYYVASFSKSTVSYQESHDLAPDAHLRLCQQFASQRLRPVSISAAHTEARGIVAASIWKKQLDEP